MGSHVQNSKKGLDRTVITSGGPGNGREGSCAIGIGLNNSDGSAHAQVEDWYDGRHPHTQCLCDGPCDCHPAQVAWCNDASLGSLYGKDVHLTWMVYHDQQGVHYDGYASVGGGDYQRIVQKQDPKWGPKNG
jgi:hypothetical protein